jgi:hypothetical protein
LTPEPHDRPQAPSVVDLDRRAWSVPAPVVEAAGPVREIWPVRPVPSQKLGSGFFSSFDDDEAA